jgi:para-nitrobenzyl esterase
MADADKAFLNPASLSRRNFGHAFSGSLLAAILSERLLAAVAPLRPAPVVDTFYGKVAGNARHGIAMYKGIPYGAHTGGTNRFLPPKPPAHWPGVRDCTRFGSPAPQVNTDPPFFNDPNQPSEDCLVLNVWTPSPNRQKRGLPVIVWLHGGAFVFGSAGAPGYDCFNIAKAGNLVAVSINHRLNAFGYLYLGDSDERFASAGNVGQLDLIAALQWIRDNIAAFGGDPGNVTIFGESGGGAKVGTLIGMPGARGLYHKAIIQSGSIPKVHEPAQAEKITHAICTSLGIRHGDIEALQQVSTEKLVSSYNSVLSAIPGTRGILAFQPVVDGRTLPRHPWSPAAPDYASRIPIMIGTTRHETASFFDPKDLAAPLSGDDSMLARKAAEHSVLNEIPEHYYPELLKQYRRAMPELSDMELVIRLSTDTGWWRPAITQAERKIAVGGPPVFMYEYAWTTPWVKGNWAMHGIDLPFMFGNPDYPSFGDGDAPELRRKQDPGGDRYLLANLTMKAWAAFAHSGNPSTPELAWPAYDLKTRPTMIFDRHTHVVNDPRSAVRPMILALQDA